MTRSAAVLHRYPNGGLDLRETLSRQFELSVENVIAGVVITFMDVTKIIAAEARISELTRDLHNRIQRPTCNN